MRSLIALVLAAVVVAAGCSAGESERTYGAQSARMGAALSVLGWNISVSNLRFDADHVLVDVDAAPAQEGRDHVQPGDLRFGLYGALAHPLEADALTGCRRTTSLDIEPATAPKPDRLTGTVCLGPLRDRTQVRGVYVYSTQDRIPETAAAYPAAFPVGVLPTNENDTGLTVLTSSVEGFRADGTQIHPAELGDPAAFAGNGYMLLGLQIDGLAARYQDDSTRPAPGLSHACSVYGSSVLVLPDSSLDAVQVRASLCTQGEMNAALLYATVSVVGTHAGLWTTDE